MGSNFHKKLKETFSSISLTELNASASFMDRVDTKFLLTEQQFIGLVPELQNDFYVLEIGGKSVFEYDSIYMDTDDYDFYRTHQAGDTSRTKVRTREYLDSGIAFFEYKQKQGKTLRKFRYPIDLRDHGKMTKEAKKFHQGISMSFYGADSEVASLSPSLRTEYNRLTLCSKTSAERVTIDFDIKLTNLRGRGRSISLHNAVIIESKTTNTERISNNILKKHGINQVKGCSKYCMGLIMNGLFDDAGKFKTTIKKLKSMS